MLRRLALLAGFSAFVLFVLRAAPTPPPSSAAVGSLGRGPTVVLVHGLGSDANHWLPVARDLARDHRVVLIELPGHGLAPMARPFTLEQAMQNLAFARKYKPLTDGERNDLLAYGKELALELGPRYGPVA